jgi:hypothetical protein
MTWIQTAYRNKVDLLNPDPASIDVRDIAHALARIGRYNSHTREHYSVAEHSCHVSDYLLRTEPVPVARDLALAGLMHDTPEAYLGDTTAPMQLALGAAFKLTLTDAHRRMWRAIAIRYKLLHIDIEHARVKDVDRRICLDECAAMLGGPVEPWAPVHAGPLDIKIHGWIPQRAELEWTQRMVALTSK